MNSLRSEAVRRNVLLGLVVSLALVAGACGGGDDDDTEAVDDGTATTATTGSPDDGDTSTTTPGGGDGAATTSVSEPGTTDGTGGTNGTGGESDPADPGTGGAAPSDASAAAPDMTSQEICALLPAETASAALGIADIVAAPGTTDTPQCSYQFARADGAQTDATVAALRTAGDMGGKFGDDAFAYVVEINKAAAQNEVTETPLDFGNNAVLLTGGRLHMAIVQVGGRIITVLLNTDSGDAAAVAALAQAASVVLTP